MANTSNPPDYVRSIISGTWGVDFDREETTTKTGPFALKFIDSGTSAAELEFDDILVEPDRRYRIEIESQGSSNSVFAGFQIYVDTYDAAGTLLTSTQILSSRHSGVSSWQIFDGVVLTDATAAFMRIRLIRSAGFNWAWIVDRWEIFKLPAGIIIAGTDSATTANPSAWSTVDFQRATVHVEEKPAFQGIVMDPGRSGWWHIDSTVMVEDVPAGKYVQLRLQATDGTALRYINGPKFYNDSGGLRDVQASISATVYRPTFNDNIDVQVFHDGPGALLVADDDENTWFTAVHVE